MQNRKANHQSDHLAKNGSITIWLMTKKSHTEDKRSCRHHFLNSIRVLARLLSPAVEKVSSPRCSKGTSPHCCSCPTAFWCGDGRSRFKEKKSTILQPFLFYLESENLLFEHSYCLLESFQLIIPTRDALIFSLISSPRRRRCWCCIFIIDAA